jgi:cyclopropane fatty-acyl-phospholipid synthase-like methyltransferase
LQPATNPSADYKALVARGYDQCAARYAAARQGQRHPELAALIDRLPAGAAVLDAGCGAGLPIAGTLVEAGFRVTGIDLSAEQVRLACANVPGATFIHADLMAADFAPASFDAIVAYYAIFHLPRVEHPALFARFHRWLRPGGFLLATVTQAAEDGYTEPGFFGVTMYWSNYGLADYQSLLASLGFDLLDTTSLGHGYTTTSEPEHHPLLFAQNARPLH